MTTENAAFTAVLNSALFLNTVEKPGIVTKIALSTYANTENPRTANPCAILLVRKARLSAFFFSKFGSGGVAAP